MSECTENTFTDTELADGLNVVAVHDIDSDEDGYPDYDDELDEQEHLDLIEEVLQEIQGIENEIGTAIASDDSLALEDILSRCTDMPYLVDISLSYCVENNKFECALLLIAYGADVNNNNGYPLITACWTGNYDLVHLLVAHGADIRIRNDMPLSQAIKKGHLQIVKFLAEYGADLSSRNNYALRWACRRGHVDFVRYLIANGVDVNTPRGAPLRLAATMGHSETVMLLIENDVDIFANEAIALRRAFLGGHVNTAIMIALAADRNVPQFQSLLSALAQVRE